MEIYQHTFKDCMKRLFTVAAFALTLSGCAGPVIHHYTPSAENVVALRSLEGKKINVGEFKDPQNRTRIGCRDGWMLLPGGEPYVDYIKNALVSELKFADAYSASSNLIISGELEELDSFTMKDTHWLIKLTITLSNGKSFDITEKHSYPFSFAGAVACPAAGLNFNIAVQNVIKAIINSPEFKELVTEN